MVRARTLLLCPLLWLGPDQPEPVWAPLGPVPVRYVAGFEHFGMWEAGPRRITLRAGMDPVAEEQVRLHEACHAALWDLGVVIGDEALEDRVCDAWATARMLEKR